MRNCCLLLLFNKNLINLCDLFVLLSNKNIWKSNNQKNEEKYFRLLIYGFWTQKINKCKFKNNRKKCIAKFRFAADLLFSSKHTLQSNKLIKKIFLLTTHTHDVRFGFAQISYWKKYFSILTDMHTNEFLMQAHTKYRMLCEI